MEDLKKILNDVFKSSPQLKKKEKEFKILGLWPEIVGEKIAKHSKAIHFYDNGILFVVTDNHAWMQNLRYLEQEIKDKMNAQLIDAKTDVKIEKIIFRLAHAQVLDK